MVRLKGQAVPKKSKKDKKERKDKKRKGREEQPLMEEVAPIQEVEDSILTTEEEELKVEEDVTEITEEILSSIEDVTSDWSIEESVISVDETEEAPVFIPSFEEDINGEFVGDLNEEFEDVLLVEECCDDVAAEVCSEDISGEDTSPIEVPDTSTEDTPTSSSDTSEFEEPGIADEALAEDIISSNEDRLEDISEDNESASQSDVTGIPVRGLIINKIFSVPDEDYPSGIEEKELFESTYSTYKESVIPLPDEDNDEEVYVPEWKDLSEEEHNEVPEEPEGFEEEPDGEGEEEVEDSISTRLQRHRKRKKAVVVADEDLPAEERVSEKSEDTVVKPKEHLKDIIFSVVETIIAAAVCGLVGYQLGGVVLNRMLENIIGG